MRPFEVIYEANGEEYADIIWGIAEWDVIEQAKDMGYHKPRVTGQVMMTILEDGTKIDYDAQMYN